MVVGVTGGLDLRTLLGEYASEAARIGCSISAAALICPAGHEIVWEHDRVALH